MFKAFYCSPFDVRFVMLKAIHAGFNSVEFGDFCTNDSSP